MRVAYQYYQGGSINNSVCVWERRRQRVLLSLDMHGLTLHEYITVIHCSHIANWHNSNACTQRRKQHYAVYTRERVDNATANNPFCIILISLTDMTSRIMIFKIIVCDKVWTSEFVWTDRGFKVRQFCTIFFMWSTKLCKCVKWYLYDWVTAWKAINLKLATFWISSLFCKESRLKNRLSNLRSEETFWLAWIVL